MPGCASLLAVARPIPLVPPVTRAVADALLAANPAELIKRGWNQARGRDYFDLWRILRQFQNELDRNILEELLRKKSEVRDVSFHVLDDFFTQELVSEAQRHWTATLTAFVPDLPSSDQVLRELKELLPSC